jgi:Tol biopolymer transport system component
MLLFVRNGRDGARGAPVIYRYDTEEDKVAALTGPGYLEPSYSPDGRFIAATRTSPLGTDVVILHGSRGTELLRVTGDGRSWAPVWSPAGDAIAFLHIEGQSVDLQLARISRTDGTWSVVETIPLTDVSGLDAASRPDWYVPPEELPTPTPPPTAAPSATPAT